MNCDVAIIGGGPGGSTLGTYLKKYAPYLKVAIFERETFPRDHVGESQLPIISYYLDEMGVWDKVEAAGFPIKIGATYRWGRTKELWDFNFVPKAKFEDDPRPGRFEGQRRLTAFQVDRAIYDEILLNHAAELGCRVFQDTKVTQINTEGDRVTGLQLESGESVKARYYIDASGHSGVLRRAMNVPLETPSGLQNIAIWDYWQNADWAEEIGVGGTRIQILSVGFGWLWFIPLSATRTSVGLVLPAEYFKKSGKRPQEIYDEALGCEDRIKSLMTHAVSEGSLQTTKDWSFVSTRLYGENWFLVGESAGFADPILSAGLSITHAAAREAAFSIIELERGQIDAKWLKEEYAKIQTNRVRTHIRFADYWYSANEQFSDLKDYTAKIAEQAGLDLSPDKAWAWLAQGGFIDDSLTAGVGGYTFGAVKSLGTFISPMQFENPLTKNNVFTINLEGSHEEDRAAYRDGSVIRFKAHVRNGKMWPIQGVFEVLFYILSRFKNLPGFLKELNRLAEANSQDENFRIWVYDNVPSAMEALIADGWIIPSYNPSLPLAAGGKEDECMQWHHGLQ